ncbi:unnamed protein product [Notodromas monacha]|uniref:mTERF domain-containing protein 1, mitochondrial n=1 Tax=Notodromas monacha TaxID=399045 RepID=A0A7R9G9Z0_9CRUS|nr:unnamed protein product [Notodromas monacha]CAG0913136.1 unnamed protein product [Notodromas monacha]
MLRQVLIRCSRSVGRSLPRSCATSVEKELPIEKPWWRLEDESTINARLAEKLLATENPLSEKKKNMFDMKDVEVLGRVDDLLPMSEDAQSLRDVAKPAFGMAYNLAAYVDRSEHLQRLVDLGVDLSKIEENPSDADLIVKLNFENDVLPRIKFLLDHGVPETRLGPIITKNPSLLTENPEDLQVRVDYLRMKNFTEDSITRILSQDPFWLSFSTLRIDRRLGFFQRLFHLKGHEVREFTAGYPRLVTCNLWRVKEIVFSLSKEMGFSDDEIRSMLLVVPRLFRMKVGLLRTRFDFVHNELQWSHGLLVKFPRHAFLTRTCRLKERHRFLLSLSRAQYDPTSPNYVSPVMLSEGTDAEFCHKVARAPVKVFNDFLKTL